MKKIASLAFSAIILASLSGCVYTEQSGSFDNSDDDSLYEDSDISGNSEDSDNSDDSDDTSEPKTSESSSDTFSEPEQVNTVPEYRTFTIANGETLEITDEFTVKGTLECDEGGYVVVRSGARMTIDGTFALEGTMRVEDGGEVDGDGTLKVVRSFDDIDCIGSVTTKIDPPAPVVENGITTIGGVVIANKKISLPPDYGNGLEDCVNDALKAMRADSGYTMKVRSGFRSYEQQAVTFQFYCDRDGEEVAETYSSRPGHSEHQLGLTVDITLAEEEYGYTDEGKWVADNCYKYGFIIRYPKGKDDITGYTWEPWHLRYLGKSTAKLVYLSGLTLEEFLNVEG